MAWCFSSSASVASAEYVSSCLCLTLKVWIQELMEFNYLLDKSWKFHTRTCWNITYLPHSLLERFWLASHYIMYIILWKSRILNYFFLPKYSWISTSLISKFISFRHVWTSRINGWTVWNKLHTGQNDGTKLKVDAVCLLGTLENVVYTGFVFMYVCVTVTSNHLPCPHRESPSRRREVIRHIDGRNQEKRENVEFRNFVSITSRKSYVIFFLIYIYIYLP